MNPIPLHATGEQPEYAAILALPTCRLGVRETTSLQALVFLPPTTRLLAPGTPLSLQFARALDAWMDGAALDFPVPARTLGTDFQRRVWEAISAIPRGQTRRYGDLARQLGSSAQAVGQACGANPFPIIVPCHRVIAASGPGGFANARNGWLLETKKWLLELERHKG